MTTPSTLSEPSTAHEVIIARHQAEVTRLVNSIAPVDVHAVAAIALATKIAGGTVYVVGNGGSAANASHCAAHLMECGIRAQCLMDNSPMLTALSNDFAYSDALKQALERAAVGTRDALIAFSCSGTSPNIVAALKYARQCSAKTAAVFGFRGREGQAEAGVRLIMDSIDYAAIEDSHSAFIHMLRKYLLTDS